MRQAESFVAMDYELIARIAGHVVHTASKDA